MEDPPYIETYVKISSNLKRLTYIIYDLNRSGKGLNRYFKSAILTCKSMGRIISAVRPSKGMGLKLVFLGKTVKITLAIQKFSNFYNAINVRMFIQCYHAHLN